MPNRILQAACPKPVPDNRFRMTKSPKQKAAITGQCGGQAACAAVELMIISSLGHSPAAFKWIRAPFPVPYSSPCVDPAAASSES